MQQQVVKDDHDEDVDVDVDDFVEDDYFSNSSAEAKKIAFEIPPFVAELALSLTLPPPAFTLLAQADASFDWKTEPLIGTAGTPARVCIPYPTSCCFFLSPVPSSDPLILFSFYALPRFASPYVVCGRNCHCRTPSPTTMTLMAYRTRRLAFPQ